MTLPRLASLFAITLLSASTCLCQGVVRGEFDQNAKMAHSASAPSTTLTVTGLDGKATTYSIPDVQAMPHTTVSVYNEHTRANERYAGVPLTELLSRTGAPTGEKLRGKAFLLYVIAEGTDHYRVVYSIDETDPANHAGEVIVADSLNGAPLAADGAFKLVSTEDKRPARWVRNLTAITIKSAE
jgi:hypothetical protein